ncbi:Phytochrome [Dactylellina cionopaga]|nr:Phytochrome [Dactylellina cionopaga]
MSSNGISFTPQAAKKLQELMRGQSDPNLVLRLSVQSGGANGMQYGFTWVDKRHDTVEGDMVLPLMAGSGEASAGDTKGKEKENEEEHKAVQPIKLSPAPGPSRLKDISVSSSGSTEAASASVSTSSTSLGLPALRPFVDDDSSSVGSSLGAGVQRLLRIEKRARPKISHWEPNLNDVEVSFLRVVGKAKVSIATPEDVQLDSIDRRLDAFSRHGATMQVHRGTWKGRRAAFKFIRRNFSDGSDEGLIEVARAYRRDMYDLNFELQIMSKASLRDHPNITRLLGIYFDTPAGSFEAFAEPGLIVELAHEQYPDLASFFDDRSNPSRPRRLPYKTGASLLADIGDGVQVLHDHDLVHADLKPGNILIFPNEASPCGLTAKIADFGFTGMTTYTRWGQRAPLPDGRPRGGTPEWNAPECLKTDDEAKAYDPLGHHPEYDGTRDIYSFGLLAAYIALDGQSPKQYIEDPTKAKLSDEMTEAAVSQIEKHYNPDETGQDSLKNVVINIVRRTLNLVPQARAQSIRSLELRKVLLNDLDAPSHWPTEFFVLDFELFPQSAREFRYSGFYDAYWACPQQFRQKVRESFRELAKGRPGMLGQYVKPEIWELLDVPES